MGNCKNKSAKYEETGQKEPMFENKPADYECAISATKYGKFNLLLTVMALISTLSVESETAVMSYIIPMAVCDLNLTSNQKGLLNSMAFLGMVLSGFFWGFLLDTLGRKKMLFIGFIAETLVTIGKGLTTRISMIYIYQFLGGALIGGLYIAVNTYLHEFHSTAHRGYVQMMYGATYSVANILIPLMSASTILLNTHFKTGLLGYFSWNILILISVTPSLISAILFYFLPETPKFLMSSGKNDEALRVFRQVYKINTGERKDNYKITSLVREVEEKDQAAIQNSWFEYVKLGWLQILPLFGKEHRLNLFLVSIVHSTFQFVLNTLRLYLPQVFQAAHDYEVANNKTSSICDALTVLRSPNIEEEKIICSLDLINNFDVYLNSIVISVVLLIAYVLAGTLINTFGKRNLLNILNIIGSISISCLYFSTNTTTTLVLSSAFFVCLGICFDLFITIIMVIFPTTLRAMAFAITLLLGRLLTIVGNLIIPWLVNYGCAPLFLTFGSLTFGSLVLSWLIPDTDKMDMK